VRRTSDGAKLIFPSPTGDHFGMPLMLFDLGDDVHERDNRLGGERDAMPPDVLDKMRELLRVREKAADAFDLFDGEDAESMDAAGRKALEALGYVGPGFSTGSDDEGR